MRWKRLLVTIVALLIALPAIGLGLLAFLGADRFRPWIERQAHTATGRELKLEGPLELDLGLHPRLALTGVSLAGPAGDSPMLRARLLEAQLALLPLLRGQIDMESVRVDGLDLRLARDADGRGNWELGVPKRDGKATDVRRASTPDLSSTPIFRDLEVRDSRITWQATPDARPAEYVIAQIRLTGADPARPAELSGTGLAVGAPFTVEGEIGPIAALARERKGELNLRVTHGGSKLHVQLDIGQQAGMPRINGRVEAETLDLRPFQNVQAQADGKATSGKDQKSKIKLIPASTLDLGGLHAIEADIDLSIDRLSTSSIEATEFRGGAKLADGKLVLRPSSVKLAGGELRLEGSLADMGQEAVLALDLAVDRMAIGQLLALLGVADALDSETDLRLQLGGKGTTPAALAASLEGQVLLGLGEGKLKADFLDRLTGGDRAIGAMLFPGKSGGWILLQCGALELPVRAGIIDFRAAVVDTQLTRLDVSGSIDLGREKLDLVLSPTARAIGVDLAIPVKVGGSLVSPEIGIARGDAALGTALNLLTGTDSVAAPNFDLGKFADRGMAANPCLMPGKGVAPAAGGELPKPRDVIRDLKQGLEDLFGKRR